MINDIDLDADEAAFESHLKQLEGDELSSFTAAQLLRRIQWKDGTFGFLDSEDNFERRMVKAVTKSSHLNKLCWVLAWQPEDETESGAEEMLEEMFGEISRSGVGEELAPEEDWRDEWDMFLATTVTLYDLTIVSPHEELMPSLASSLQCLQPNQTLRRLELQSAHLPLVVLCSVISQSKTLRVLSLQGKADLDDAEIFDFESFADLELFSDALAVNTSLRELHMQWINFHDEAVIQLSSKQLILPPTGILRPHKRKRNSRCNNTSLNTLVIRSCHFHSPLAVQILLTPLEAIATMNLNGNRGFDSYMYQIYLSPNLRNLRLVNYYFPKQTWLELFLQHHKHNLETLYIHSNRYHDMEEPEAMWQSVVKFLRDKRDKPAVTFVDLHPDPFEESPPNDIVASITTRKLSFVAVQCPINLPISLLGALSSHHCTLRRLKLSVSYNALEKNLKYLLAAVGTNQSLEELEIVARDSDYNVLTTEEAQMDGCWEQHLPRFSLRRFALTNCHTSPGFYDGLFQTLPVCPSLTELELGWIASFTNQTVDSLCKYLRMPSCTLVKLWLRGHSSSTSGNHYLVSEIMPALTANQSLRTLSVACTLSDFMAIVTPQLSHLSTMQNLELTNIESFDQEHTTKDILRAHQIDMVHALRQNKSLVSVDVSSFFDPHEHLFPSQVRFYGMRNKIRQTAVKDQHIPPGLWPHLLEHVQQKEFCPTMVFHVLRTHVIRDRIRDEPKVEAAAMADDCCQPSCHKGCLQSIIALFRRRKPKE